MDGGLSAHDRYVAILSGAVEATNRAVATLKATADTFAEVKVGVAEVTAGSAISDLSRIYAEGEAQVRGMADHLEGRVASINGYISRIGGGTASGPAPTQMRPEAVKPETGTPGQVTTETIERLKRELPDPIKPDDRGRKTHGRWVGQDGKVHETVSGRDDDAALAMKQLQAKGIPRKPLRTSDVEMKLAARMADKGITEATVIINNVPCEGVLSCDTLVPILLPDGSALTVHGVKPDGTPFVKRYEGGARPWWH
ncbi:DddA-like double-stranded DNA deaminase toxin [Amycolatopsis sp. NPDC089917]|uniref:DddA-like double-stranded DNA deaminase toxin n=1 Tax=Amycolatopsis sp. NPDC089917 TaxID=3155187 RepID=UPI00343B5901